MSWFLALILAGSVFTGSPITTLFDIETVTPDAPTVYVQREETEVTEQVFPINPDGKIEVSNINGSINIEAWDRPEVKLISKKVANTRERLSDIEVKVNSSKENLKVEVDYKRWQGKWIKGDSLYVDFSLMVPRTAVLDEIESINGDVTILGAGNKTVVSTVNGSIRASELKGSAELSTVNGSLMANFREVTINSSISLSTVNGSAEIRIPSNVDATLKGDSVNGSITNGFGLPVRKGEYVGRYLYGRIGSGASKIGLDSVNGSLKISRLDDGLPLRPVENLLPSKISDDFDDSFEGKFEFPDLPGKIAPVDAELVALESLKAAPEINKEAIRSAAAIAAETAKAGSEALKAALSSVELARLDERRLAAELARAELNVFGSRAAPYLVEDSKSVAIEGIPDVSVEAYGSNVIVKGWDRKEIKYTVSRIARGRLSPVQNVNFNEEEGTVRLEVKLSGNPSSDMLLEQVQVELWVPQNSNLKITTNREIRVQGVTGELKLTGQSGSINVRDAGGRLDVKSKTALVRVIGFDGSVESRGYAGDMYLEGNFSKISSSMESGDVFLTLSEDVNATISTNKMGSKGKIGSDGTLIIGGLRLENKADGIWKLGQGGKAEFEFRFTSGKLQVRPLKSISAE